jgi:hypothetical protein
MAPLSGTTAAVHEGMVGIPAYRQGVVEDAERVTVEVDGELMDAPSSPTARSSRCRRSGEGPEPLGGVAQHDLRHRLGRGAQVGEHP